MNEPMSPPDARALPLAGLRVLITRPAGRADDLAGRLRTLGAKPVLFPTIRIADPPDPAPLRRAARNAADYDWIVFTSANGVERFWSALESEGVDPATLADARIACIGPATAAALHEHGRHADLVPDRYVAEAVLEAMAAADRLHGRTVLLPRAYGARAVLPRGLAARGAHVHEVEAYRAVGDAACAAEVRRMLDAGDVDVVTFTSSSTVHRFVDAVGDDLGPTLVAVIGPITAATARELGLHVTVEAESHTVDGLIQALVRHFDPVPGT